MLGKLLEATESFQKATGIKELDIVIITGTGITIDIRGDRVCRIDYSSVRNLPLPSSKTHSGYFDIINKNEKTICIANGRIHYYEKYSIQEVVFGVRMLGLMKPSMFIITNAAGGLRTTFETGDIMAIVDHINLMGVNPLKGDNIDELGERFPDMSEPYSKELLKVLKRASIESGVLLKEGVYVGVAGPSLETPAETRFLRLIGADAVGMSSVPEVIAIRHMGIDCIGLSVITNLNKPDCMKKASLESIVRVSKETSSKLSLLLNKFIEML